MLAKSIAIILLLFVASGSSAALAAVRGTLSPSGGAAVYNVVYSQPSNETPLQQRSSQVGYDRYGSDYDEYVWDSFVLDSPAVIDAISWRGFYRTGGYAGGGIVDFIVAIYPSSVGGTQPDHLNPPLVQYTVGGTANESPDWMPGSVALSLHDYSFVLPVPFTPTVGVKYWLQIEGVQNSVADWGIVGGTGGDNSHFYAVPSTGDFFFNRAAGDTAFALLGTGGSPAGTALVDAAISGPTAGVIGESYAFTATVNPLDATPPITYTWSPPPASGQGTAVATYSWSSEGSKAIGVTATNSLNSVTAAHSIDVGVSGTALSSVSVSGPAHGVTDTSYTFTATISPLTATPPITFTWSPEPIGGQGTAAATYSWSTPGSKSISVSAHNSFGAIGAVYDLEIDDKYPARLYLQLLANP